MRILQLIDSLEAGGAERMAVNFANALANSIEFSGLVATRKEGPLFQQINKSVSYLYIEKGTFDLNALFRLRNYVIKNRVGVIHAHSTSFFIAFLLKMTMPSVKIIWHNHYGDSEAMSLGTLLRLRIVISFFGGIVVVNQNLKNWTEQKLYYKNVLYLPNFPSIDNSPGQTPLQGIHGKRVVCLANLRVEKNHFMLLEIAQKLKVSHPDWSFHLVGKDFEDYYSKNIKKKIREMCLSNNVFVYGSRQDIKYILDQSSIAVLTSYFEGLPVALLEYGLYKKPVVVTAVGEIPMIICHGQNGFITSKDNADVFYSLVLNLIEDESLRSKFGTALEQTILENHSETVVIDKLLKWI